MSSNVVVVGFDIGSKPPEKQKENELKDFTPDSHATEITENDKKTRERMKCLFYNPKLEKKFKPKFLLVTDDSEPSDEEKPQEKEVKKEHTCVISRLVEKIVPKCSKSSNTEKKPLLPKLTPEENVLHFAREKCNGREVELVTDDEFKISALYFERENAKMNIIYVIGWFYDASPSKEWCAPFAEIFPDFNLLCFDWRGMGKSKSPDQCPVSKSPFGTTNSHFDIKACVDFIRKENDQPIVLHGFCAGGLLSMLAVLRMQEKKINEKPVDAIGLSCTFGLFKDMYDRAHLVEKRLGVKLALKSGLAKIYINGQMNGSLFDLDGVDLISNISKNMDIPFWFDHVTHDIFSELKQGVNMYNKVPKEKRYFFQCDFGKHIRAHAQCPHQYGEAYCDFLKKFKLL